MLVWFALTGLSVAFVGVDIRSTPAHPVLKWAFVILALFTGPFAAFFYVLGCRDLDAQTVSLVLNSLVNSGFLARTRDGAFTRA